MTKQKPGEKTGAFSAAFAQKKEWKLDPDLWRALLAVLPDTRQRIVDLGAGAGTYVTALAEQGHFCAGVDGIENIEQISGGAVRHYDLTKRLTWNPRAEWALCIEVGEHIPAQFESTFLENLADASTDGLIVSWAYPGQRGRDHINCREESWVRREMGLRGWSVDEARTALAKETAGGGWKKKLCVFARTIPGDRKPGFVPGPDVADPG